MGKKKNILRPIDLMNFHYNYYNNYLSFRNRQRENYNQHYKSQPRGPQDSTKGTWMKATLPRCLLHYHEWRFNSAARKINIETVSDEVPWITLIETDSDKPQERTRLEDQKRPNLITDRSAKHHHR